MNKQEDEENHVTRASEFTFTKHESESLLNGVVMFLKITMQTKTTQNREFFL
jgi:hypothetical protein